MTCDNNDPIPSPRVKRLQQWLAKAKRKHGDNFDYSKVCESFVTQKSPEVRIYCNEHGAFWTTPDKHVQFQNGGCVECGNAAKSRAAQERYKADYLVWLQESLPNHLDVVSDYLGPSATIHVRCKKHWTVKETTPTYLKNNKSWGCDLCAREATNAAIMVTLTDVKKDLEPVLPEGIAILDVESDDKGPIILFQCDLHGDFSLRKGTAEKARYFCPKCANAHAGYAGQKLKRLIAADDDGADTWIAVMEVEVFGVKSLKVGVTTRSLEQRYKWYLKAIFFKCMTTERVAYIVEQLVHREFLRKHDRRIFLAGLRAGKRWAGDTETYYLSAKDEIVAFVQNALEDASQGRIDEADIVFKVEEDEAAEYQGREKDLSNMPVPVVGIDPKTKEVVVKFSSMSEASRAGYRNVSLVLNPKSPRKTAGGLKWMRT